MNITHRFSIGDFVGTPHGVGKVCLVEPFGKLYTVKFPDKTRREYRHESLDPIQDFGTLMNENSNFTMDDIPMAAAGPFYSDLPDKLYLSIPYSHERDFIEGRRHKMANRVAAFLMGEGNKVFSPISHSVAIEGEMDTRRGHDFWMKQDLSYLEDGWAGGLVLIQAGGWRESEGVREELLVAYKNNIPVFNFDPIQVMQIVGISGRKRSGKDTFANVLCEEYGYEQHAFADPIRTIAREVFGLRENQIDGSKKEVVDPRWNKSPREILQLIGTECFRDSFGSSVWVDVLMNTLRFTLPRRVVVSDVRFPNEVEGLQDVGGRVGRIYADERLGEPEDGHASETALSDYQDFDFWIPNNGSEEAFIERCIERGKTLQLR